MLRPTTRLPALARGRGFDVEGFRSHRFVETSEAEYMATIFERGADILRAPLGGRAHSLAKGYKARITVLEDVRDERVTIGMGGPTAEFDEFAPQAQKVRDSVELAGT